MARSEAHIGGSDNRRQPGAGGRHRTEPDTVWAGNHIPWIRTNETTISRKPSRPLMSQPVARAPPPRMRSAMSPRQTPPALSRSARKCRSTIARRRLVWTARKAWPDRGINRHAWQHRPSGWPLHMTAGHRARRVDQNRQSAILTDWTAREIAAMRARAVLAGAYLAVGCRLFDDHRSGIDRGSRSDFTGEVHGASRSNLRTPAQPSRWTAPAASTPAPPATRRLPRDGAALYPWCSATTPASRRPPARHGRAPARFRPA